MTKLRNELRIPPIDLQILRAIAIEAWKNREKYKEESLVRLGPITRGKTNGDIPLSHRSVRDNKLRKSYNELSITVKRCNDPIVARKVIKRTIK